MQKRSEGFLIRDIRASDIPELVVIGKERLGRDYISDVDFTEAISYPGQFCLVIELDGRPVGFSICREFGPEDEHDELDLPDSPQRDMVLAAPRIGLLDSVAIEDGHGGLGYGRMLIDACLRRMAEGGCTLAVSMAWVHRDGVEPIRKALSASGFIRSDLVIEGYWNEWVGSEGGHDCPICGAPCHCFGAFWHLDLARSFRVSMPICPP